LQKVDNVDLMVDHERKIGSTKEGTLKLNEDEIGLRAEAVKTDEEVIEGAKKGKLKGWSFNMMKVVDEIEERAGKLPLRRVKDFVMTEITLAMNKIPVYSATSIEIRAEEEEEIEIRTTECEVVVNDLRKTEIDYSEYENKIKKLKGE